MAITKNSQIDLNGNEMILDADGDTTITADTDDQIDFKTGGSDRMTIASNGNTTIKSGLSEGGGVLNLENTATSVNGQAWGSINFISNDSSTGASGTRASIIGTSTSFNGDGNLTFSTAPASGSNTERMRIDSDGNLLLGTTTRINNSNTIAKTTDHVPLNLRRDNGASDNSILICVKSTNTAVLAIRGDGDVENTNNSYGALSDERLKSNIVDASSQLEDIKKVKVRNYTLDSTGETHLGVIAQELEEAGMGGLVVEREEGYKGVKYSILYMKAIKAIQEQQDIIEDLKARIETLEGS